MTDRLLALSKIQHRPSARHGYRRRRLRVDLGRAKGPGVSPGRTLLVKAASRVFCGADRQDGAPANTAVAMACATIMSCWLAGSGDTAPEVNARECFSSVHAGALLTITSITSAFGTECCACRQPADQRGGGDRCGVGPSQQRFRQMEQGRKRAGAEGETERRWTPLKTRHRLSRARRRNVEGGITRHFLLDEGPGSGCGAMRRR